MTAEALFRNGGAKVFDNGGIHVGYVWVEPAPGDPSGQMQYWVLKTLLDPAPSMAPASSYVFESWASAPGDHDHWIIAVDGLWQEVDASYYVVSQSTVIVPSGGINAINAAPLPVPPRRDRADELRQWARHQAMLGANEISAGPSSPESPGAGPPLKHRPRNKPQKKFPQVVVPFAQIHQGPTQTQFALVGECGGTLLSHVPPYFEGEELFLLRSTYASAGAENMLTRIKEVGNTQVTSFEELRTYLDSEWQEERRYERTVSSYYFGEAAPPPWYR